MTATDERRAGLHPHHVAQLHSAVSRAESMLLFAAVEDPALEPLRERACELSCDLLSVLSRLERCLVDGNSVTDRERETLATWAARQAAGSGNLHGPKPNGRRPDGVEWPTRQAELARARAARAA